MTQRFKAGDKVVMHTCGPAQTHAGRIWTCTSDQFTNGNDHDSVFLEGFRGSFDTAFLQKVNLKETLLPIEQERDQLQAGLALAEADRSNLLAIIQTLDQELKRFEDLDVREHFMDLVHNELVAYQEGRIAEEYTSYYQRRDGIKHMVRGKLFMRHRGIAVYVSNRVLTMGVTGMKIARDVPFDDKQKVADYMDRNWGRLMQICVSLRKHPQQHSKPTIDQGE